MKLTQIVANGFRSLEDIQLDIDPLTVLIGENDSGKSSILDLLDIFLNNRYPEHDDFRQDAENNVTDQIEVVIGFSLEDGDEEASELDIDNNLLVKKLYTSDAITEVHYWGERPVDERLTTNLSNLSAQEQKTSYLNLIRLLRMRILAMKKSEQDGLRNLMNEPKKQMIG
jgi:predicted ATP-dependent endonuclease of OLD family